MENCNRGESTVTSEWTRRSIFSLKINKRPGYDDISFNIVRNCFGPILKPSMAMFNLFLQKGCFPLELHQYIKLVM